MDVIDEHKKSSNPTLTPSQQCSFSGPTDHVIPQMVITSADDTSEEQCNVTECTLVLIPPVDVSSLGSSGQESVSAKVSEDKHEVDFEDISVVVRDVVSKCTDTVSHSVRQRPLVMEVDKCVQQDESVVRCPTPPSPPPPIITTPPAAHQPILTSPTTMQRPLRFEGVAKTETSAVPDSGKDFAINKHIEIQDELISDAAINEVHSVPQICESTKFPVDSSCSSSTTKEGSHGVKKFFDSLWHSETQTSVPDTTEPVIQPEHAQAPKSEKKSSIKNYFHSPKSETPKDKSELPELPEQPFENKEPGSFTKDAKQSIKSFFDTFKHESQDSMDKNSTPVKIKDVHPVCLDATVAPSLSQLPSKDGKDSKQHIKSFFSTFKHESSDSKIASPKKSASHPDFSKESQDLNVQSPETHKDKELPKIAKESSSFTKDTKHNIKALFDTFKHESSEQKHKSGAFKKSTSQPDFDKESNDLGISLQESLEVPKKKDPTSFTKETKQNLKSFFDTFKHEPSASKHKDVQKKLSDTQLPPVQESVKEFDHENKELKPDAEVKTSTSFAKDTKQNIKAFFDTFKHESGEQKHKEVESITPTLLEHDLHKEFHHEDKEMKADAEVKSSTSFVKDTKQNIKSFFKHDSDEQKYKEVVSQKPILSDHEGKEINPCSVVKPSASFAKDTRQNIKAFFKHDSEQKHKEVVPQKITLSETDLPKDHEGKYHEGKEMKPNAEVKASTSFSKDTKQNIKAFFDTFKHDSGEQKHNEIVPKKPTLSEPDLHKESANVSATQSKDSKNPLKKIFSFKHSDDGSELTSVQLSGSSDDPSEKELKKHKPLKVSKSVKLDLVPTYSWNGAENIEKTPPSFGIVNGHDNEPINGTKERAQSVPSDTSKSNKHFGILSESSSSAVLSPAEKSPEEVKENLHGFRKFFDSFKHEKSDIEKSASCSGDFKHEKKQILTDSGHEMNEVKTLDKSTKNKKSKGIQRSLSDKVSREEVVQNFKGFFDSIGNKSSSKKSVKEAEHIYDMVEVKTEMDSPLPVIQVSSEVTDSSVKSSSSKNEGQGMKKFFSSFHSKDSPKPIPDKTSASHRFWEKDSSKVDESLKKDVLHESKKSTNLVTDLSQFSSSQANVISQQEKDSDLKNASAKISEPVSSKPDKTSMFNSIGENILALKEKMMHGKEKRKSEILDDLTESAQIEPVSKENSQKAVVDLSLKEESIKNANKMKPILPEKPAKSKTLSKAQTSPNKSKVLKEEASTSPGSPNSLYDTCCMKIAVLLRDKALDIVSERTKLPPPKPPKPSAETIARARAAAVSRRLEAQRRGQSIGDNIPVGCDGIRFADDETESSCDYKDVENFDYIMDYELINRYKLENKFDTFSVPSTCSGLTSYYTADTITLRSDIYSDAVLETVSLNSDASYNMKQISSSSKSEPKIFASIKESQTLPVTTQPKVKKVPPPIPPKPMILQNISKIKTKSDNSAVSSCVNGLSLSPRLQNKFSKDPAATQKRPLMVADVKGTQFSSLPHSKSKTGPKKPARSFDTVLRNESLKNVSGVPSAEITKTSVPAASKISSPSIPSPQNSSRDLTGLERIAAHSSSSAKIEKRTISPPRPPPPKFVKKVTPQRPPPPVKHISHIKAKSKEENVTEYYNLKDEVFDTKGESSAVESSAVEKPDISQASNFPELLDKTRCDEITRPSEVSSDSLLPQREPSNTYKFDVNKHKDELNNNIEMHNDIADSLNNNVEVSKEIFIENPKPPPRNRRIRSRTVEIVPPEKSEERLKRSQSLSELDIEKRIAFLQMENSEIDSKSLYTVVNKEGKRLNNGQSSMSSPDLVSSRPLPAPPPPPRRFRSLERKGKLKSNIDEKMERAVTESPVPSADDSIKPPSRRKRTDKQRFLSLHSERKKETDSDSLKRASSVPTKPDRRIKSPAHEKYDVNANIFSLGDNFSADIPKADSTDSFNKDKSSKQPDITNPRKISHSSWYDEHEALNESWEIVDSVSSHDLDEELKCNPKVPMRHKLDSKRKNRETSKFYVNVEQEHRAPPLVDKETSPLPLDCSEKSVQTSLETLSQGIVSSRDVSHDVSHDDQSDDTDELLDLAQTLQKELSTIINRHKFTNDSTDETPSPPLSAGISEKNLLEEPKELKKTPSVRSSASEVWPMTSSDESDVEAAGEDSANLNEMAAKRKKKKIFYIAQEIMTSEEVFVDALKLLNIDFKAAVETASQQRNMSVIPDDALSQILNHLPQLQHLNENLLMELKDRIENWEKTGKIADIIVKMGPFLKLYSWYIHDFESNLALLEDCKKKYPVFAQIVKEFETSPRCKRLTLNHYMLKPIQRIPQYRLLLQEYFHHLAEDSSDYYDTVAALQIVSEVANHANDSMKHGDNAQKLISIQNSIMGHKEIVKPGRVFVKEGELMKLSRKGMQPRWFVLFNDLLLYLTPVQQGLYRVNHELPLTGMKVAIPIQQDYQNEFSIISVTRSFTLAARSPEERQEWIVALTKAIEENASKRSTFTNTRLHQKAQDKTSSEDESAFVLGRKAPVWIPDARVTMCQLCTSEFTVTFRRHHCRACGKVVCSICSSHRISLQYLGNRIARVCDECHIRLGQGSSACTESGETDSDNQQIAVKSHLRTDNRHIKKNKRALPSVLKEVCANDQGSTISGYLHKKTGKSWKRDWFVVKDKVLYEYRASEDVAALKSIPLLGYQIELFSEACENIDASLLFQLTHPGQAPVVFYADTVGSTERWVSALKTATVLE